MSWYWIVSIIVIYIFGWGVSAAISKNDYDDVYVGAALGMIWPIVLPFYVGYKLFLKEDKQ